MKRKLTTITTTTITQEKKNNKSSKISNNEDKDDHLIFGRRLNYLVETEITTDIPISIIEDIKIKEKKI